MEKRPLVLLLATTVTAVSVAATSPAATARVEHKCPRGSMHVIYQAKHRCLSLAERKQIYKELAHYQDTHPGQDVRAYTVIAKRWRIPLSAVKKIAFEGASNNWPLPPLP